MSTATTWEIESSSSDDTFALGERFGRACRGGELFVLSSDVGGGKTTFTKGLAKGLGCDQTVSSPTFTVSRVYTCRDGLKLYHFDFYRLADAGVVGYELAETMGDDKAVTAIEWGDIVAGVLPERHIELRFERTKTGEDSRRITCIIHQELAYLAGGSP